MLFKQAAQDEICFYTQKLYPLQDDILNYIQNNSFYLTGGTTLSRYYYNHRFSDDLDFFYDGYQFSREGFNVSFREIVNRLDRAFPAPNMLTITIDGEFFKRLFITRENISLKLEFIYENYKTIGTRTLEKNIWLDSKENICANKIGTVMERRTTKDFVDLFYLLQTIDFEQAVQWSEYKRIPPGYENLMIGLGDLLKAPDNLEGTVLLIKPIDQIQFSTFTQKIIGDLLHASKNR